MSVSKKIYIFPHCHVISGYSRSILQDTFRERYYFIPNLLRILIPQMNGKTLVEIKNMLSSNEYSILDEYISFLKDKEIAFLSDSNISYQSMNLKFTFPAYISNAIYIHSKNKKAKEIKKVIQELTNLNCENIQFFSKIKFPKNNY